VVKQIANEWIKKHKIIKKLIGERIVALRQYRKRGSKNTNARESDNDIQIIVDNEMSQQTVKKKELEGIEYDEKPSKNLCCPISMELMKHPVMVIESEQTYDKKSIEIWFANQDTDPLTGKKITNEQLITNFAVKRLVDEWVEKHEIKK
jgi:hypothetical protein